MSELIHVKLVRSPIGTKDRVRQTLRGLGLGKVGSSSTLKRSPQVEGMLRRVPHLVVTSDAPSPIGQLTQEMSVSAAFATDKRLSAANAGELIQKTGEIERSVDDSGATASDETE